MENSTETKNFTEVLANGYLEIKNQEAKEREKMRSRQHELSKEQLSLEKYKVRMQRPAEVQIAELKQEHEREIESMKQSHEKMMEEIKNKHEIQLEKLKFEENKPETVRLAEIRAERNTNIVKTLVLGGVVVIAGYLAYKYFKGRKKIEGN